MAGTLSGDVTIPKVGKLPKVAVFGGVAAVIALIIWQNHKNNKAAAAPATGAGAAASDPYPPDGTVGVTSDPNSTDPSTGQTYGDEAAGYSASAGGLGDLYGTGYGGGYGGIGYTGQTGDAYPWDGTYGNPNDPYSMDPSSGITYGNEGNTGTTGTTSGPPFSTNAQWSQYVLNYFSTNQYSDIAGRTDAIGLYLTGQTVTTQQKQYIDDAIAVGGSPPVAGTGGFPPSIRTSGSTTTTGTATVPKVTGMTVQKANAALRAVGLVPGNASQDNPAWVVYSQTPGAGKKVQQGSTVNMAASANGNGINGGNPPHVTDVAVPNVTGQKVGPAHNALVRAGLVVSNRPNSNWVVTSTTPRSGTKVAPGSSVSITAKP